MLFARWIRRSDRRTSARYTPWVRGIRPSSYVLVRRLRDSRWWAGPDNREGRVFVSDIRRACRFRDREQAASVIAWMLRPIDGFEFVEVDSGSLRQPSKAPPT